MSSEIVDQAELEKLLDGETPTDLSGKTMVGIDLDGRTIRGVVFSAHQDSQTLLKEFSARGASLIDCVLAGAEIDGSALQGARLVHAIFDTAAGRGRASKTPASTAVTCTEPPLAMTSTCLARRFVDRV